MAAETRVLDVTRTQLIQAPPARVLAAFFNDVDLKHWWQVTRAVTVARPLGMYAIEWESTDFRDHVLGRLGGAFHGTVIDYRVPDWYDRPWAKIWEEYFEEGMQRPEPDEDIFKFE